MNNTNFYAYFMEYIVYRDSNTLIEYATLKN